MFFFFFFNDTATTEIYTLSLHDALPILISELRAVTLVPGLEPNAWNAGEKRLAAGGCLQACTGKDRVSFHTVGAPALRPGAIAQSPGREAALCRARLPKACPASSVRARKGAGCGSEIGRA